MSGKGGGRKGNIRKRRADSSDEEGAGGGDKAGGEGVTAAAPPPAAPAAAAAAAGGGAGGAGAVKTKAKKDKGITKGLSFGGDGDTIDGEEDETFVLKKKKPKERKDAAIAFKKGGEGDGKASSMGSYYSGGSYTDADMAALSKNAKSIGGKLATAPASGTSALGGASAAMDAEGKKLRRKDRSGSGMDAPVKIKGPSWAPKHDDDDEMGDVEGPRVRIIENRKAAAEIKGKLQGGEGAAAASEEFGGLGGGGGLIPTDDDIARLKARRELARQHAAGEGQIERGFIKIEEGACQDHRAKSRLAVDEFNEEEDDIVGEVSERARMTFGKGDSEAKQRRTEITAMLAATAGSEMEQGGASSDEDMEVEASVGAQSQQEGGRGTMGETRVKVGAGELASFEETQRTLRDHLKRLRLRSHEGEKRLEEASAKVKECKARQSDVEGRIKAAQNRYTFFQETRAFLEDLLAMLDAKAPVIEDIEDELYEARQTRSAALLKRRRACFKDEVAEARDAIQKATGKVLPKAEGEAEELDEFGRDPSFARGRRMKEHADRRAKTVERKRKSGWSGGVGIQADEEMWTTDESDSEVNEWSRAKRECENRAKDAFEDVKADFREIPHVFKRFTEWRRLQHKAYKDAWVHLSIPRILSPYVRREILGWDPLEDGQAVESMAWVSQVFQEDAEGEEDELIPRLVESVVAPKVIEVLRRSWDPSSTSSTARAVGMLQDLVVYVLDVAPDVVKELQEVVVVSLEEAFELHMPGLGIASGPDAPNKPGLVVSKRAFKRCCKLVANAASFREVLSPVALQALTMDKMTSGKLMPFLFTMRAVSPPDAGELADTLVRAFPDEWQRSPKVEKLINFTRRG